MIDDLLDILKEKKEDEEDQALRALRKLGTRDLGDAINDFIRAKMRERSFARYIFPPSLTPLKPVLEEDEIITMAD